MRKVTVTFDSNVWENIVDETKRSKYEIYICLYESIKTGTIEPFFFEGIATLESIPKNDRKDYIKHYRATISFQVNANKPHITKGSDAPEITDYLHQQIPKAIKLGFRFITFPRVGAPRLNIEESYFASDKIYPLQDRLDRTCECARFVESLGAGKFKLHNRLDGSASIGIIRQTAEDVSLTEKQYAKHVGEWVDGDALSAHYGYGLDYFCTNDKARGAGTTSVFSPNNLQKLRIKFGIEVVSPQELLNLLERKHNVNENV
ncbi:MAG: hypothetical protein A2161_21325 [Candidatus Schekmanbacteria bacterium RBG_13_48_7]|uniref:Uncharacterized protein n=1 Tax=Candidatus Schekmanbacteria bacterium RBG_13_48_7 TaxID=1817878 RepID=A0A1F7RUF9_9BACT|nr:MAG: hypothetical protein A2161_21325 [Candidatus Schekmanbacteria bacterium RBG_13_48_7]